MEIKDYCDIHGEPICIGDVVRLTSPRSRYIAIGKVHLLTEHQLDLVNEHGAYEHYTLEPDDEIEIISKYKKEDTESVDMVNHPPHYQSKNGIEVIDVIEAFTEGLEGGEATNTGNVIKYILRWKKKKNPLEDLKKARWYIDRLIKIVEAKENVK